MAPKLPHWVTCPFRAEYKDNPKSKCFNCHAPKFMDCKYREEKSMQIAVINGPDFRPVCSKDRVHQVRYSQSELLHMSGIGTALRFPDDARARSDQGG